MRKMCRKLREEASRLRCQLFTAYFVLFAAFFILVVLMLTTMVRGLLVDQIGGSRLDVLRQIAERANIVKTSSVTLSNLYTYEISSHRYLQGQPDAESQAEAASYLDRQKQVYDEVFAHIGLGYEVLFLGENGFSYCSDPSADWQETVPGQLWYRHLLEDLKNSQQGGVEFSRTFSSVTGSGEGFQFAAGRIVTGLDGNGVLLILIDEQLLENLYSSVQGQGSEIFIYDQDGLVVSHSNKKMLGKQFFDVDYMRQTYGVDSYDIVSRQGQDYLLSTFLDEEVDWTIVEMIPTNAIFGALDRLYWMVGCLLAGALVLAMLLSWHMARRVARPLSDLSAAMDRFGTPEFVPPSAATGTQELDHLQESFNHMAGEIDRLMAAVREREGQKRQLEMNFLRAQINPHFLYNMLFSIRCTIEVGKSSQAAQMLSAFTDLLRSTLAVKAPLIPLQEELESTRKYLVVQKLRCGDKINYEFDVQPGTKNCLVPPLILQPLVENAIFHGLEAKPDADMLVISTAFKDGDLLLTVTDDGAGMGPEELAAVRERMSRPPEKDGNSIGMANVHSRIRLNWGEPYGLTVDSTPEIGTTVTLRMPAVFSEERNDHEGTDRG